MYIFLIDDAQHRQKAFLDMNEGSSKCQSDVNGE